MRYDICGYSAAAIGRLCASEGMNPYEMRAAVAATSATGTAPPLGYFTTIWKNVRVGKALPLPRGVPADLLKRLLSHRACQSRLGPDSFGGKPPTKGAPSVPIAGSWREGGQHLLGALADFEAALASLKERQDLILDAMSAKKRILGLPNVVGVGVGLASGGTQDRAEAQVLPWVLVSKKLPLHQLSKGKRIPRRTVIAGERHQIRVVEVDEPSKDCTLGVADTQLQTHDPIPPDVQFGALEYDGTWHGEFTGGAYVRLATDRMARPSLFLLTARHAIDPPGSGGLFIQHPVGGPLVGGHVHSSVDFDAAVAEIFRESPPTHCFGPIQGPIPALPGMRVKKSGVGTGVTGGIVRAVVITAAGGRIVAIDNQQRVQPRAPFGGPGDSGSLCLLGSPTNALDFGFTINGLIDTIAGGFGPAYSQRLVRFFLSSFMINRAVSLYVGRSAANRIARSLPIAEVLADLGVVIV